MFQDSVLEFRGGWRGRWIALGSVAAQAGLLAGFVAWPLLYPERLPSLTLRPEPKILHVAMVKPPQPVKPVVVKVAQDAAMRAPSAAAVPASHSAIISRISPTVAESDIPVLLPMGGGMRTDGPPIVGGGDGVRPGPVVTVKPGGDGSGKGPMRISSIAPGMLLTPIRPIYPTIAKASHTSGTVVVSATIDAQGHIAGVRAVSGPMMLRDAATDAVKEARYRPFLLNGKAIEVETTISVNFVMGS